MPRRLHLLVVPLLTGRGCARSWTSVQLFFNAELGLQYPTSTSFDKSTTQVDTADFALLQYCGPPLHSQVSAGAAARWRIMVYSQ